MQHLDALRLAALDHDPPTPAELAHISACAHCRAERDAYARLGVLANDARAVDTVDAPRLTDWTALSAELRREGLLRTTDEHAVAAGANHEPLLVRSLDGSDVTSEHQTPASVRAHTRVSFATPLLRIAAALILVLGGAWYGRSTVAAVASTGDVADATADVVNNSLFAGSNDFVSVEEATRVLTQAQRDYERASLWLASNDTTVRSPDVYRARLAALDQMMAASRAALRDAPQDPVLNHYYLAAYTAREATLQQLISTLPVDKTIEGF